jgi:hypothetical protein
LTRERIAPVAACHIPVTVVAIFRMTSHA